MVTSTKSLLGFPIKELGNDNRGLIVRVIPERFNRGSSSYFTTTFGVVTAIVVNAVKVSSRGTPLQRTGSIFSLIFVGAFCTSLSVIKINRVFFACCVSTNNSDYCDETLFLILSLRHLSN